VLLEHVHEGYEKDWWDYTEKLWTSHIYLWYKIKYTYKIQHIYTNMLKEILTTIDHILYINIYVYVLKIISQEFKNNEQL